MKKRKSLSKNQPVRNINIGVIVIAILVLVLAIFTMFLFSHPAYNLDPAPTAEGEPDNFDPVMDTPELPLDIDSTINPSP